MPVNSFDFKINENDIVIAADSGIINAKKFNIEPDYIIGDFDSLDFIPENVEIIWNGAFSYCKGLECVELPNSLKTIRQSAFKGCISLKEIYIPQRCNFPKLQ